MYLSHPGRLSHNLFIETANLEVRSSIPVYHPSLLLIKIASP